MRFIHVFLTNKKYCTDPHDNKIILNGDNIFFAVPASSLEPNNDDYVVAIIIMAVLKTFNIYRIQISPVDGLTVTSCHK